MITDSAMAMMKPEQEPLSFQLMLNDLELLLKNLTCPDAPEPTYSSMKEQKESNQKNMDDFINELENLKMKEHKTSRNRESRSSSGDLVPRNASLVDDSDHRSKAISKSSHSGKCSHTACSSEAELRSISYLERLTKTHPIWYLPDVTRAGATHLLKDRETGTFIVRCSSQPNTMALSVQFPHRGDKRTVEHYLIESAGDGLHLQGSTKRFSDVSTLIAHYCENSDELPHHLVLPAELLQMKSAQELSAHAMLGQAYWTSPIAQQEDPRIAMNIKHPPSALQKSASEPSNITSSFRPIPLPAAKPSCSVDAIPLSMQLEMTAAENGGTMMPESLPAKHVNSCGSSLISIHEGCEQCYPMVQSVDPKPAQLQSFKPKINKSLCLPGHQYPHSEPVLNRCPLESPEIQRTTSNTHPRMSESKTMGRDRNGLYFTTSLDLLNSPATRYFRSELSDRMSDYEDIWKSPVTKEVKSRKNGFFSEVRLSTQRHTRHKEDVSGKKTCGCETRKHTEHANSGHNGSGDYDKSAREKHSPSTRSRSVQTSLSEDPTQPLHVSLVNVDISANSVNIPITCENVYPENHTASHHQRDLPTDSGPPRVPPLHEHIPTDMANEHTHKQHRQYEESSIACQKLSRQAPRPAPRKSSAYLDPPKHKPPPLPSIARDKNVEGAPYKSPVYAEPWDSISSQQGIMLTNEMLIGNPDSSNQNKPSAVSRNIMQNSRPVSQQAASVRTRRKTRSRRSQRRSHNPKLETIYSPNPADLQQQNNFNFEECSMSKGANYQVNNLSRNAKPSSKRICRSHSLKAAAQNKESKYIDTENTLPAAIQKLDLNVNSRQEAILKESCSDIGGNNIDGCERNSKSSPRSSLDGVGSIAMGDIDQNDKTPTSPGPFPVFHKQLSAESIRTSCSEPSTIEDLISFTAPELTIKPSPPLSLRCPQRSSEYDNLVMSPHRPSSVKTVSSVGTIFSKPWDSDIWQNLLKSDNSNFPPPIDVNERIHAWRENNEDESSIPSYAESNHQNSYISDMEILSSKVSSVDDHSVSMTNSRPSSLIFEPQSSSERTKVNNHIKNQSKRPANDERIANTREPEGEIIALPSPGRTPPTGAHPCLRSSFKFRKPGMKLREYISSLSQDTATTFGKAIDHFIQCTTDSPEADPNVVVRNVRQFMTGIKNYLIKHGEGELEELIERERSRLGSNEFLNIDAIIEGALHICVIQPLKQHIYRLFVQEYTRNGNVKLLSMNIKYARCKTPEEIGIKPGLIPPQGEEMSVINDHMTNMQREYSPVMKLDYLLAATSCIHSNLKANSGRQSFSDDDFLRIFIYVLVHCGIVSAEIEAEYMRGLLHPSLLTGEGGYYLTTLSSAVQVLKNFHNSTEADKIHGRLPNISDSQDFLRIAIPDELRDSIVWKTLPVRPNMTTKNICTMIAHKLKVTNPQDYSLYLLVYGEESRLNDMDCPQHIKADHMREHKECFFAYKRTAVNIAWPKVMKSD